jgi:hypothetical protein
MTMPTILTMFREALLVAFVLAMLALCGCGMIDPNGPQPPLFDHSGFYHPWASNWRGK